MHFRARVHRWVVWWFYVGVACGVVAVVNILGRSLSPWQVRFIIAAGVLHWLLGGLVCYAFEGIQLEHPHESPHDNPQRRQESAIRRQQEWHAASDFLLPGNSKSLVRRDYRGYRRRR